MHLEPLARPRDRDRSGSARTRTCCKSLGAGQLPAPTSRPYTVAIVTIARDDSAADGQTCSSSAGSPVTDGRTGEVAGADAQDEATAFLARRLEEHRRGDHTLCQQRVPGDSVLEDDQFATLPTFTR